MKKPFLYGFQGKARWKTNKVFFCAGLIIFFYIEIGKLKWSIELAKQVPFIWK